MRNYQKELDCILKEQSPEGKKLKLLLHSCCAPCSSYVLEYLSRYFDITLLYYNPNISPEEENTMRGQELLRLVKDMEEKGVYNNGDVCAIIDDYEPWMFESLSKGLEDVPEGGSRCYKCYELRMRRAAAYGAEHGFDYFTTTLSISPMKNANWINEIGESLSEEFKIKHLPSEFKKKGGYLRSIQLSKEYDLYRQNYCGCIYSKNSRK